MDILGLGAVAVDELIFVETFPPPDSKTPVLSVERRCGGLTGTALMAAARCDATSAYAGVLGIDEVSDFAVGRLEEGGVDTQHTCRRSGAKTIRSFVVVDAGRGTRNVFSDSRGFGPGEDWPPRSVIEQGRVLLVDHLGVPGMIRAATIARRHGIAVVGDLERESHPRWAELLGLVDHRILSLGFAAAVTGTAEPAEAAARLWAFAPGCSAAVVTCGADGCWWVSEESAPRARHLPAYPVNAVDTTGCGDVFHGVYAAWLTMGRSVEERLRAASAAAAIRASRTGGLPGRAEIAGFLDGRSS